MGLSVLPMHNPPHPGEFLTEFYLKPNNLSARELTTKLDVARNGFKDALRAQAPD
jgi:plasmid maintenance system antidote protein VapI